MSTSPLIRSVALFVAAGLMEIGGGYRVWVRLREHGGFALGALGELLHSLYGGADAPTRALGRVYAAYGGVFVVLSLLWGQWLDGPPTRRARHSGSSPLRRGRPRR